MCVCERERSDGEPDREVERGEGGGECDAHDTDESRDQRDKMESKMSE